MKLFKDWAVPGPEISALPETIPETESLDALSGHFKIFQLKNGHRFSTDDLLVAWYATTQCPSARRALDLGSGIGTVAQVSAFRLPGCHFTTIEAQSESVHLAKKSIALNRLEDRFDIREGDFRETPLEGTFDLISGSPPYFPIGTGVLSEHPQKVACRFEVRGNIADYCQIASRHLAPSGVFAFVFVNEQHERAIQAAENAGLWLMKTRPVVLKEGEPPLLRLYACMKKEHIPKKFHETSFTEAPLIIRTAKGEISTEYTLLKLSIGFPP